MTTVEVLKAARARIERGWCQLDMARDGSGKPVDVHDPEATKWCAFGALMAVGGGEVERTILRRSTDTPQFAISIWNDAWERTQAQVLSAFDAAIALAEAATSRDAAGMKR